MAFDFGAAGNMKHYNQVRVHLRPEARVQHIQDISLLSGFINRNNRSVAERHIKLVINLISQ